jgi:RNA polymerase sigma-70 factor (ECF subfamily)
MFGAHRRAAPPPPGGAGFRALAELVLAVLRADPAFAVPAAGAGLAMAADAGVAALPTTVGRPPDQAVGNSGGPRGVVDEVHVETWELVGLAQKGDGQAFAQLYERYFDTVFKYIYYRLNDRAMAEDFTSETFLRALRRIGGISYQGRDIGAWFITIARNIVLDHVKSARHRLEMTTGDVIERRETEPSPEVTVISSLTSEHLIGAVKRLGREQRDCIVHRFIQGLSVSETAEVMGKNDGAIKALQHRAVHKLADMIGEELR